MHRNHFHCKDTTLSPSAPLPGSVSPRSLFRRPQVNDSSIVLEDGTSPFAPHIRALVADFSSLVHVTLQAQDVADTVADLAEVEEGEGEEEP